MEPEFQEDTSDSKRKEPKRKEIVKEQLFTAKIHLRCNYRELGGGRQMTQKTGYGEQTRQISPDILEEMQGTTTV